MSNQSVSVNALLANAQAQGFLSAGSANSLQAPDIGRIIQAGLGMPAEDFESSEIYGCVVSIDDSGSIRFRSNTQVMRDGVNGMKKELWESAARDDIALLLKTINGEIIYPYGPLSSSPDLNSSNYNPNKGTPLYDSMIADCGLLLAKWREFHRIGAQFRGSLLWVTDGNDEHSEQTAEDVRRIVEEVLAREIFILMFMGIDDGCTNFKEVALSCGIPEEWVLTPANDGHEIRQAFAVASRASKSASQGAASFSQVAGGGGFGGIV